MEAIFWFQYYLYIRYIVPISTTLGLWADTDAYYSQDPHQFNNCDYDDFGDWQCIIMETYVSIYKT